MDQPAPIVQLPAGSKNSGVAGTQRFLSLDVFRGMTICLMIIVNTPGKGATLYPFLVHAKWLGFTLADLVFPSFLFAVGNAMSFSEKKLAGADQKLFLEKVVMRFVLIFLAGYLMYWFPFFSPAPDGSWTMKPFSETRVMGVLQRIALCYLLAALMVRYFSRKTTWIIAALLLPAYWAVLYLFGDQGQALSIGGNAITKLDIFLLGEGHIYRKDVVPFDPEGILSTFPALVNVLAGYWVGVFMQQKGKSFEALTRMMVTGVVLVAMALTWDLVFPISKKLWTGSFVLCTIGIDILVLSVLIYWVEIRKRDTAVYFFTVFGKNPLFIYLLSELLYMALMLVSLPSGESVFEWASLAIFQRLLPGAIGALATAVCFMMICWCVGWWLDRKKIYIRI
jgi:predicted acyltransferase